MKTETEVITLSNGLRAVLTYSDGNVAYIGACVNAGTRDEPAGREGLAHFVEHTIFKGTRSRSSWHISNRMERVGGELNAYTYKEGTVIYTNAPAGHEDRAMELIADLIRRCNFPLREIEREREVIIEEINACLDNPADSIFDSFEERIFNGSAMSHNILGTPQSVRSLTPGDARGFVESMYTPGEMTLYCTSPLPMKRAARLIGKYFGGMCFDDVPRHRVTPPPTAVFDDVEDRDRHQAHMIIGARLFGRHDPRRFPLFLLNNYLGGPGMNSRLNQEVREKRGLAYSIDSSVSLYSDCGLFLVYCGSDAESSRRCRRLITTELERLATDTLPERALHTIKEQYCGQLLVNSDNRENAAISRGRSLLHFNRVADIAETMRLLREVTPQQIREVAELIAPEKCSTLTFR